MLTDARTFQMGLRGSVECTSFIYLMGVIGHTQNNFHYMVEASIVSRKKRQSLVETPTIRRLLEHPPMYNQLQIIYGLLGIDNG